jgi:hypothetical protein
MFDTSPFIRLIGEDERAHVLANAQLCTPSNTYSGDIASKEETRGNLFPLKI